MSFRTKKEIEVMFRNFVPNMAELHMFVISTNILELIKSNRNVKQKMAAVVIENHIGNLISCSAWLISLIIISVVDTSPWIPKLLLECHRSNQYQITFDEFGKLRDKKEIALALEARLHEDNPDRVVSNL